MKSLLKTPSLAKFFDLVSYIVKMDIRLFQVVLKNIMNYENIPLTNNELDREPALLKCSLNYIHSGLQ